MTTEYLYDAWASRNPNWELRYEETIVKNFCDYGKGSTSMRETRGKLFGAGYEIFIIAFFIGLYFNQRRPLTEDANKKKTFGQPIKFWGNLDSVRDRKAYPKLREYIFIALIAKTDVDFIALEKGEISLNKVIKQLMDTMEEYANFGFNYMADKMIDNPGCFYSESAFLELFLSFGKNVVEFYPEEDDLPESLD